VQRELRKDLGLEILQRLERTNTVGCGRSYADWPQLRGPAGSGSNALRDPRIVTKRRPFPAPGDEIESDYRQLLKENSATVTPGLARWAETVKQNDHRFMAGMETRGIGARQKLKEQRTGPPRTSPGAEHDGRARLRS
jgi:hypothetical protein